MGEVRTNNVPRPVVDPAELTETERAEFDYLDWPALDEGRDSASFFRFKGQLYDLGTFERTAVQGWDGQHVDSFFSAVLVKFVNDGDEVIVGETFS